VIFKGIVINYHTANNELILFLLLTLLKLCSNPAYVVSVLSVGFTVLVKYFDNIS